MTKTIMMGALVVLALAAQLMAKSSMVISPIQAELTEGAAPDALSLRLTNDSDVGIEALVVFWKFTPIDSEVPIVATAIRQDFYAGTAQIEPHSSGIVSYGNMAKMANLGREATITVDSVLYADGRVAGDNHFGLDKYIARKWQIRSEIARSLRQFRGREASIHAHLAAYVDRVKQDGSQPTSGSFWGHEKGLYRGWADHYKSLLGSGHLWEEVDSIGEGK